MSDPKKTLNRPRLNPGSPETTADEDRRARRAVREQVVLRIGPAALEALERAAAEEGLTRELVLPMVYEIVIVPGPGMLQ